MSIKILPNYFTRSYGHFGLFLFIVTTLVAIPFTLSILAKQQDTRSRADFQIADDGSGAQIDINGQSQNGGSLNSQPNDPNYNPSVNNNFTQGGQTVNSQTGQTVTPNSNLPSGYYTINSPSGAISCGANGCYNNSGQQVNNTGQPTGNSTSYTCGAGGCVDANGHSVNLNQGSTAVNPLYYANQNSLNNPNGSNTTNQTQSNLATTSILQNQASPLTASSVQGGTNCSVSSDEIAQNPTEQQMLTLINNYRATKGAGPLTLSLSLNQAAAWYANQLATNDFYTNHNDLYSSHTDLSGRQPTTRVQNCGYTASAAVGEIIAGPGPDGNPTPFFQFWQNSPHHNAIMIDNTYKAAGIAGVTVNGKAYWVVDFGGSTDGTVVPTITAAPTITQPPVTTTIAITQPISTVTQIPQTTLTQTPQVGFSFTIHIPGIGNSADQNNNPNGIKILQVAMFDPSDPTKILAQSSGQLGYNQQNGTFGVIVPAKVGTYDVKVRTDNSLWQDLGIANITADKITTVAPTTLITGDLNQDNALNLQDYTLFISCYGTRSCPLKSTADLNQDGKVNEIDLNIFYSGLANRNGD